MKRVVTCIGRLLRFRARDGKPAMRSLMHRIDSEADIAMGLAALAGLDPRLEAVIALAGNVPLRRVEPGLASLVSIIVAQQVSRASAAAILARLTRLLDPLDHRGILACGEAVFREAGLSRAKQATLLALAAAIAEDRLDLYALAGLDADEARLRLTGIRGVGPWTADVYLLAAAGHADIFPAGDVALQGAVGHALGLDRRPDARTLSKIAESWSPWRAVAARLFWAYWGYLRGGDAAPLPEPAKNTPKTG